MLRSIHMRCKSQNITAERLNILHSHRINVKCISLRFYIFNIFAYISCIIFLMDYSFFLFFYPFIPRIWCCKPNTIFRSCHIFLKLPELSFSSRIVSVSYNGCANLLCIFILTCFHFALDLPSSRPKMVKPILGIKRLFRFYPNSS
jgi:hypothetical protein